MSFILFFLPLSCTPLYSFVEGSSSLTMSAAETAAVEESITLKLLATGRFLGLNLKTLGLLVPMVVDGLR